MTPRKPKDAKKRKPGRPPKPAAILRAQQNTLLERHANGETVTAITRDLGIASSSPWRWEDADPTGFGTRYARARQEHAHAAAASVVDIADGIDERAEDHARVILDAIEGAEEKDKEHIARALAVAAVQRDRLRMDGRKWYTGKVLPRIYGDRVDVTSGGEKLASGVLAVPMPMDPNDWSAMAAAQQAAAKGSPAK